MYKIIETIYDMSRDSSEVTAEQHMIQHSHTLWSAMMYTSEKNKDQDAVINLKQHIYRTWSVARETKWDILGLIQYNTRYYPTRDEKGNRLHTRREIYPEALIIDWDEFWDDVL